MSKRRIRKKGKNGVIDLKKFKIGTMGTTCVALHLKYMHFINLSGEEQKLVDVNNTKVHVKVSRENNSDEIQPLRDLYVELMFVDDIITRINCKVLEKNIREKVIQLLARRAIIIAHIEQREKYGEIVVPNKRVMGVIKLTMFEPEKLPENLMQWIPQKERRHFHGKDGEEIIQKLISEKNTSTKDFNRFLCIVECVQLQKSITKELSGTDLEPNSCSDTEIDTRM